MDTNLGDGGPCCISTQLEDGRVTSREAAPTSGGWWPRLVERGRHDAPTDANGVYAGLSRRYRDRSMREVAAERQGFFCPTHRL